MIYQLKDYLFNTQTRTLSKGQLTHELTPKTFRLLLLFAHSNGQIVSKKQIHQQVWGGRIVSETNLYKVIQMLRQFMGDNGNDQTVIKTIHGEGYLMTLKSKKLKFWQVWICKTNSP